MPIQTTTIGAYPKPEYVPIPDWFQEETTVAQDPTRALDNCRACHDPEVEDLLDRGTQEVVLEQVQLGIDIPSDGEVRRENYIHYHCRNLAGIDFSSLTRKAMRDGQWVVAVPTVNGPVKAPNRHSGSDRHCPFPHRICRRDVISIETGPGPYR